MSCTNPNCNPGCGCNNCCPPVPPPVPPTPPICIGENCVEHYDGACVIYTGPTINCVGINTNSNINTIIQALATRICNCCLNDILIIEKTASNLTPLVNTEVTFTITVTNTTNVTVTNVVVTDVLNACFELVSYTVTDGTWNAPTWTIGEIDALQVSTLTMTVKPTCYGSYENVATLTSDQTGELESSVTVCTNCCQNPLTDLLTNSLLPRTEFYE